MTTQNKTNHIKKIWREASSHDRIWDRVKIKGEAFYFQKNSSELIKLSSFSEDDLPAVQSELTLLGKLITRISTFANIMSRRPGTEEVTFYALKNEAHGQFIKKLIDQICVKIAGPPFCWRREQVVKFIAESIIDVIKKRNGNFAMLDIGCGGGFDGLEVQRIMHEIKEKKKNQASLRLPNFKIINNDIDRLWLNNNKMLSELLFSDSNLTVRRNKSIFDYINKKIYLGDLRDIHHLIISCNGFAEFLQDHDLIKLLLGIKEITNSIKGDVYFTFQFCVRNPIQVSLATLIGFRYIARERNHINKLIKLYFEDYKIDAEEKYNQVAFSLRRGAD